MLIDLFSWSIHLNLGRILVTLSFWLPINYYSWGVNSFASPKFMLGRALFRASIENGSAVVWGSTFFFFILTVGTSTFLIVWESYYFRLFFITEGSISWLSWRSGLLFLSKVYLFWPALIPVDVKWSSAEYKEVVDLAAWNWPLLFPLNGGVKVLFYSWVRVTFEMQPSLSKWELESRDLGLAYMVFSSTT